MPAQSAGKAKCRRPLFHRYRSSLCIPRCTEDFFMTTGTFLFLLLALGIALAFEAVNGCHDTANAVATVIYTKSLRPQVAVVWSGLMNFLGVILGGVAVAYSIVHLLPVD